MRLTKKDYFEIYMKFGYIINILYHADGALFLKDLCRYTNKSYSQTCKDVIVLEKLKLIKANIISNSKIISLERKAYIGIYNMDIKAVSKEIEKLKENNLKACIYYNYDISRNKEIKKYLYNNYFNLDTINQNFKNKNKHIFKIFDDNMVNFYNMNKNNYKVVIRAYQIDYKSTRKIIESLEAIYHLFYILELDNIFKCDVTVVTYFKPREYNKKYFLKKILNHKTKINYTNTNRNFAKVLYLNFKNKIIFSDIHDLHTNNSSTILTFQ